MRRLGLSFRFVAYLPLLAIFLIPSVAARAQAGFAWRAEYFDNPYLIGEAKITRVEQNLNLDWQVHSPGEGIPADGFSARFGSDPILPAGDYRFEFRVDDGINLYVNHRLVLSTFEAPRPGQLIVAQVSLSAGQHHFQVDYHEASGPAYLHLNFYNIAAPPAPIHYPPDRLTDGNLVNLPNRWYAQFYDNQTLSGSPPATQTAEPINNDWGSGPPQVGFKNDHWSVRFSSNQILQGGRYTATVRVNADDGLRLIIDGVTWLDTWGDPKGIPLSATRDLAPGPHTFVIEFYDDRDYAFLNFWLRREGGAPAPAPPAAPLPARPTPPPIPVATPTVNVITYGDGVVSTGRLNVRTLPETRDTPVITVITRGNRHPIVGKNVDGSWWQIVVNGRIGWVYARYLKPDASVRVANIPITHKGATPLRSPTDYALIAIKRTVIRAHPSNGDALLGHLPSDISVPIVGRTAEWGWWQIRHDGMQGWVSARDTRIDSQLLLRAVPVTTP